MNKNLLITLGASTGTLLVGGGITAAVVVPMALEARDGLENFVVPGKDSASHSLNGKEEINYVALGDSVAAGYNGFLATDLTGANANGALGNNFNSYPEYLASSLEMHGVDVNLDNISVAGYRRGDVLKQFSEPAVINKMAEADLITTTIGGNDLLAVLQFFELSYSDFQTLLKEAATSPTSTTAFQHYGVQTIEDEAIKDKLVNSLKLIKEIADGTRTPSDIFAFDETVSQANLLDSLKKQYMEHAWWINRISDATHVYVAAPNPFASYPTALLESVNSRIPGGYTIAGYYDHLMSTITKSVTTGYDDENIKWSHAVSINSSENDELWADNIRNDWAYAGTYDPTTKALSGIYSGEGAYLDSTAPITHMNPIANSGDIHPSMYGYELMGEAVFNKVADLAGVTVDEAKIQRSETFVGGSSEWERLDENLGLFNIGSTDPVAQVVAGAKVQTLDAFRAFLTLDKFTNDAVDFTPTATVIDQVIAGIDLIPTTSTDYVDQITALFKSALSQVMGHHFAFAPTGS